MHHIPPHLLFGTIRCGLRPVRVSWKKKKTVQYSRRTRCYYYYCPYGRGGDRDETIRTKRPNSAYKTIIKKKTRKDNNCTGKIVHENRMCNRLSGLVRTTVVLDRITQLAVRSHVSYTPHVCVCTKPMYRFTYVSRTLQLLLLLLPYCGNRRRCTVNRRIKSSS